MTTKTREMTEADVAGFHRRFSYDPETGKLTDRVGVRGTARLGSEAGTISRKAGVPRRQVYVNGACWLSSRVIYALATDKPTPVDRQVDHINGDPMDDSWVNLRLATNEENSRNKRKQSCNTSGVVGVCWSATAGKWLARIKYHGKNIYLGVYADIEHAKYIRRAAEVLYHGEFRASLGVNRQEVQTH